MQVEFLVENKRGEIYFMNTLTNNGEKNDKYLRDENKSLKKQINLLKKYIVQSSIFNRIVQVELYERSQEVQNLKERKQEIEENEESI